MSLDVWQKTLLVGVGVALLNEVCCHWWVGFEVLEAHTTPSISFPPTFRSGCETQDTSPTPRLPACHHAPCHDDNELNF